ncbi:MAG: sensor hybrid histidine kinase [Schlesneria sp.]|nr:sensor hybrid histidine kinase [Schlesneria sp.]
MLGPHFSGAVRPCQVLPLPLRLALGHTKMPQATVLVAEDDRDLRRMICLVLRECGCQTVEAADGIEALQACQCLDRPIDLVIANVVMPHLSGWDLAARLRRAYPAIKVLMMSDYEQLNCQHAGPIIPRDQLGPVTDLLRKPFSIFSLSDRVRQILDP